MEGRANRGTNSPTRPDQSSFASGRAGEALVDTYRVVEWLEGLRPARPAVPTVATRREARVEFCGLLNHTLNHVVQY